MLGHEVETLALALDVAAHTDQLVFGPVIAAAPLVEQHALVEISVRGWSVSEDLYLVCHGDRMLKSTQHAIIESVHRMLAS